MKMKIVAFALFIVALAPWTNVAACTCGRPDLRELYKNSTRVFLGEAIEIELLTKDPVESQEVTYFTAVRPLETFKGSSDTDVRVTFTGKYAAPASRPLQDKTVVDPAFGERILTLVDSDCGFGMAEGKYYIFEKQGEPLTYAGWCSQRVVYETIIVLDFMRSLRDAR